MSKIDYSFKAYVMNNTNLCEIQKKVSRSKYAFNQLTTNGLIVHSEFDIFNSLLLEEEFSSKFPKEWHEAEKINHATYERNKRLKDRIFLMLSLGKCIFGTLTFTDSILDSTSVNTRKRYVVRYLSSFNLPYVANVDFGSKNNREHYHFVILKDFIENSWQYGFVKYESIRLSDKDSSVKLAKYVSKLTNHAIKETTKRCAIIYSRCKIPIKDNSLIPIKHCFDFQGTKYFY